MAGVRIILRLDDACATAAHANWDRFERLFDALSLRPLVAVIPENRDPKMDIDPVRPDFWERVRQWQAKGWTIAMHGLHHLYHADPAGAASLVPFHHQGEFVGLALEDQRRIIRSSWQRFQAEGVTPAYFIAPSHSFDRATLQAIALETTIRNVSDGLSFRPFRRYDFHWLPQQLWDFRIPASGTWTVCIHPNTMSEPQIDRMFADIRCWRSSIVAATDPACMDSALYGARDWLFEGRFWLKWRARARLRALLRR